LKPVLDTRSHGLGDPLVKEKKKETSAVKQNTSGHYSVWAEV